jgi:hypothetical protein
MLPGGSAQGRQSRCTTHYTTSLLHAEHCGSAAAMQCSPVAPASCCPTSMTESNGPGGMRGPRLTCNDGASPLLLRQAQHRQYPVDSTQAMQTRSQQHGGKRKLLATLQQIPLRGSNTSLISRSLELVTTKHTHALSMRHNGVRCMQ